MKHKQVIGSIADINGVRQYKTTFEKNGYEQEIWVNLYEYIGFRVKTIQKLNEISTNELAEKCGFKNSTIISRVKAGKHAFQIDTIYRLCMGLGCKSSDILPF